MELGLVKDPLFLMMMASVMAMSVGVPHVLFFIPTYARQMDTNLDPAVLLCATSVSDLIGRIAFGFILGNIHKPRGQLRGLTKGPFYSTRII